MNGIRPSTPAAETNAREAGRNRRKASRMMNLEEYTRLRCRESLREAEEQRRARRMRAGHWWSRLSRYAARRADRAMRSGNG